MASTSGPSHTTSAIAGQPQLYRLARMIAQHRHRPPVAAPPPWASAHRCGSAAPRRPLGLAQHHHPRLGRAIGADARHHRRVQRAAPVGTAAPQQHPGRNRARAKDRHPWRLAANPARPAQGLHIAGRPLTGSAMPSATLARLPANRLAGRPPRRAPDHGAAARCRRHHPRKRCPMRSISPPISR